MSFLSKKDPKKEKKNNSYTIIAGCGRLGANLANTLSNSGEEVVIIDKDDRAFRKLPPTFGGIAVKGDATEMLMAGQCDIKKAKSLISVTNQDNTNIMIAQIAKEMFGVENVVARLYDPERKCVYEEFGINTISPVVISTEQIFDLIHNEAV